MARRVVIVDTSNEIGGDGDIPHPGIGAARRMQVPSPDSQHHVLIEAVQNHTPEVVIVDEIGTELEAQAARTISQRGVQMIATAHGHTLENLLKNPTLNDLVGGVASVTLGDDEARRRRVQKSVLEREGPPTFGAAVEMLEIGRWRVHLDVGVAVDTLLAGYEPHVEIRELDERTGEVVAVPWLGDGGSSGVSDGAAPRRRRRALRVWGGRRRSRRRPPRRRSRATTAFWAAGATLGRARRRARPPGSYVPAGERKR